MVTSTITLYKGCKILPGKDFAVDSVSAYLETVPHTTFTNCQYIKDANKLSLSIKLDIDQSQLSGALSYSDSYNYCMIVNSDTDEMEYLYFITNKEWVSSCCIRLDLAMDVLNTYPKGTYYKLGEKTKIYRQHKDRIFHADITTSSGVEQEAHTATETGWTQLPNNTWTFNGTFSFDVPQGDGTLTTELSCDNNPISFEYELGSTATTGRFSVNYLYKLDFTLFLDWTYTKSQWGRKIDFMPEGVNATLYHNSAADMDINDSVDIGWNLVYETNNAYNKEDPDAFQLNNPINCYLYPDAPITLKTTVQGAPLQANQLEDNTYYYFFGKGVIARGGGVLVDQALKTTNPSFKFTSSADLLTTVGAVTEMDNKSAQFVVLYKEGGKITVQQYVYTLLKTSYSIKLTSTMKGFEQLTSTLLKNMVCYKSTILTFDLRRIYIMDTATFGSTNTITQQLNSIDNVDRTDTKLIKVIKLPYCPAKITYGSDNSISIESSDWSYDSNKKAWKLVDLNSKFNNTFTADINPLAPLTLNAPNTDPTAERNDYYESKLYHSELYQPKITYDSFGFQFSLERVSSFEYLKQKKFDIEFITTGTINSKFMFRFKDYNPIKATEDYPNVMIVARNNEMPLYSNSYLNYLRNGYNYDQKAKALGAAQNAINLTLSGISTGLNAANIAGVGKGAFSAIGEENSIKRDLATYDNWFGERPVGYIDDLRQQLDNVRPRAAQQRSQLAFTIGSGAVSVVNGISNAVFSAVQTENSLNAKMASLQAQAVSVAGSDDLDLLEAYSGNRAKLITYKASDEVRALMADLFYYCGYVESAQASPNTNTRYWFNFVQCDADIERTTNIGEDIKAALRALYANGVTFLHAHQINNEWTWDFDQKNENWEVSVLN